MLSWAAHHISKVHINLLREEAIPNNSCTSTHCSLCLTQAPHSSVWSNLLVLSRTLLPFIQLKYTNTCLNARLPWFQCREGDLTIATEEWKRDGVCLGGVEIGLGLLTCSRQAGAGWSSRENSQQVEISGQGGTWERPVTSHHSSAEQISHQQGSIPSPNSINSL